MLSRNSKSTPGEADRTRRPGYDEARKVYNATTSRKPRLIAKCADVADVITAGKMICAFGFEAGT
jgi:hypothetical protein